MPARTKNVTPTLINKAYTELPVEWAKLIDEMYVALDKTNCSLSGVIFTTKYWLDASSISEYLDAAEDVVVDTKDFLHKFDRKDWK